MSTNLKHQPQNIMSTELHMRFGRGKVFALQRSTQPGNRSHHRIRFCCNLNGDGIIQLNIHLSHTLICHTQIRQIMNGGRIDECFSHINHQFRFNLDRQDILLGIHLVTTFQLHRRQHAGAFKQLFNRLFLQCWQGIRCSRNVV